MRELEPDELAALAANDTPFGRAVQAETDRREARRQRDGQQAVRQQQVLALEQQERDARQTDAYRAAELRDQLDALRAQEQFVSGLVQAYDQVTLDPLVAALPDAERRLVLASAPQGFEGRTQVVTDALKRLETQWRADEAQKLRKNAAFRKQVLAEWQGSAEAGEDSPELVAVGNGLPSRRGSSINDWLHSELQRPSGRALGM